MYSSTQAHMLRSLNYQYIITATGRQQPTASSELPQYACLMAVHICIIESTCLLSINMRKIWVCNERSTFRLGICFLFLSELTLWFVFIFIFFFFPFDFLLWTLLFYTLHQHRPPLQTCQYINNGFAFWIYIITENEKDGNSRIFVSHSIDYVREYKTIRQNRRLFKRLLV